MSVPQQNMSVADQQRIKGENLIGEAQRKLNEARGKRSAAGKIEEACNLYVKAGNAFKMAKEWHRAGQAFSEAASLQLGYGRKTDAGINYMESAKCYKKVIYRSVAYRHRQSGLSHSHHFFLTKV